MLPDRWSLVRALTAVVSVGSLAYVVTLAPRFLGQLTGQRGLELLLATVLNLVLLAAVAACALAFLLVLRSWSRRGVRALALFLAAAGTSWAVILGMNTFEVEDGFISASSGAGLLDVLVLVGALVLAAGSFLRFSTLFPNPLDREDLKISGSGKMFHRFRVALLDPKPVWVLTAAWPVVVLGTAVPGLLILQALSGGGSITIGGLLAIPFLLIWCSFPLAALVFGIQNLVAGYRRADDGDRRQLLWLVAGVSTSTWMILIPLLGLPVLMILGEQGQVGWWANLPVVLWALAPSVLIASVTAAVFYTGGVDPALVLKRSTVLGLLGVVWISVYAVAESLFADWVTNTLGLSEIVVSIAVALLAAWAAFLFRNSASGLSAKLPESNTREEPSES